MSSLAAGCRRSIRFRQWRVGQQRSDQKLHLLADPHGDFGFQRRQSGCVDQSDKLLDRLRSKLLFRMTETAFGPSGQQDVLEMIFAKCLILLRRKGGRVVLRQRS
jgi:hypothetical protein